jgi:lipid-binding SYLF domain-containing protein
MLSFTPSFSAIRARGLFAGVSLDGATLWQVGEWANFLDPAPEFN